MAHRGVLLFSEDVYCKTCTFMIGGNLDTGSTCLIAELKHMNKHDLRNAVGKGCGINAECKDTLNRLKSTSVDTLYHHIPKCAVL